MTVLLLFVFTLTIFTSATLLFLVQPIIGKLLLPYLGGTPAVWNTCMVFFQAMLLLGYLYAHLLSRIKCIRRQLAIHSIVLCLALAPLLLVRFEVSALTGFLWEPPLSDPSTIKLFGWLLLALFVLVGLPFFALSASAPLLQKWFAGTKHPAAHDPYFLYAASNVGSMLALLSYPLWIEKSFKLTEQTNYWTIGYGSLIVLTVLSGLLGFFTRSASCDLPTKIDPERVPTFFRSLRWIALAFIPSSQMLGVTTKITTDIAPMPLLWILPLAIYLFSFILVFSRLRKLLHPLMLLLLPLAVLALVFESSVANALHGLTDTIAYYAPWTKVQPWKLRMTYVDRIYLHLAAFFVSCMVCHGELARTRPDPRYLTGFYLLMSFGGVLGGLFNALLCPMVFDRFVEYPLIIVLVCLLLPRIGFKNLIGNCIEWTYASILFLFGLLLGTLLLTEIYVPKDNIKEWVNNKFSVDNWMRQSALWFVKQIPNTEADETIYEDAIFSTRLIHRERNFFGVFVVYESKYFNNQNPERNGVYHSMYHGTTTHGSQWMEDGHRDEPLTYFTRGGPIGQLFEAVKAKSSGQPLNVGILGVGTGTLAAYAEPGWKLTLFDIDPAVVRIAQNQIKWSDKGVEKDYFTYLQDAQKKEGLSVDVKIGDGRLLLAKEPDGEFDLLFMDAFNSDAVPVHLITKEAIEIYKKKLKPDGIIVINIANRHLDFGGVMGKLARETGLKALYQTSDSEPFIDKYASAWVVMARDDAAFGTLKQMYDGQDRWERLPISDDPVWTDDYSNLLSIFSWKH